MRLQSVALKEPPWPEMHGNHNGAPPPRPGEDVYEVPQGLRDGDVRVPLEREQRELPGLGSRASVRSAGGRTERQQTLLRGLEIRAAVPPRHRRRRPARRHVVDFDESNRIRPPRTPCQVVDPPGSPSTTPPTLEPSNPQTPSKKLDTEQLRRRPAWFNSLGWMTPLLVPAGRRIAGLCATDTALGRGRLQPR